MSCYDIPTTEALLGQMFHGGKSWDREDVPDADMPRARNDPAHGGTHMAAMVDTRRAFDACIQGGLFHCPEALWGHYCLGRTKAEIARAMGVSGRVVGEWLSLDLITLSNAMNRGARPGRGHAQEGGPDDE